MISTIHRRFYRHIQIHSVLLIPLPILMQVLRGLDLRSPEWQSRMFWGLRSLWRMPLLCRTFMAWAICCRNMRMVSSLNVPLAEGEGDETHEMILERVSTAAYRFITYSPIYSSYRRLHKYWTYGTHYSSPGQITLVPHPVQNIF